MKNSVTTLSTLSSVLLFSVGAIACNDSAPTGLSPLSVPAVSPAGTSRKAQISVPCVASPVTKTVSCGDVVPAGAAGVIIGNQNQFVKLTSSNVSYNSTTQIFQFDMTVQNLMNEETGTYGSGVADPDGIQVFFHTGPTVTSGSGTASVANADGVGTFTQPNQPYFAYHEILSKNEVSSAKTLQLSMPSSVVSFDFLLLLETEVEYKLVISELLTNPGGTILDANGEWVEIYNAGTRSVDLKDLVIADSAASGRRPYHLVTSSVVMEPGSYATIGNTTNTVTNGGVIIDYAYGASMAFTNSLDAFKISRVVGTDTVTIDRTQYAAASISSQNGISRELKNPALDNSDMDGSNWADADVTAVYGPGGRGTPKAQNSTFTPDTAPTAGSLNKVVKIDARPRVSQRDKIPRIR